MQKGARVNGEGKQYTPSISNLIPTIPRYRVMNSTPSLLGLFSGINALLRQQLLLWCWRVWYLLRGRRSHVMWSGLLTLGTGVRVTPARRIVTLGSMEVLRRRWRSPLVRRWRRLSTNHSHLLLALRTVHRTALARLHAIRHHWGSPRCPL